MKNMAKEYEIKTMQKDIARLAARQEELRKKGAAPEELPVVPIPTKSTIPAPPKPEKKITKPHKKYGPYNIFKRPLSKKVSIPIVLIIIILLIGGGVYYSWNYLRAPEKTEPEIPVSLIEVDETDIIEIKQGEESDLVEKLKQVFLYEPEKGVLKRVLVKKETPEKYYFISFEEFFEIMGLNIPVDIVNNLDAKYTLFIYLQGGGNMFGFVVEAGASEDLEDNLRAWEKTMAEDLKPIFLDHKLEEPATEEFQDNIYKDVSIRYLNFSDPSLTIDYAVVGEYLIVTTSKESMYGVIDRILVSP